MQKYDYIIIGAGMGALSTACFLSKYGKKVLVLEKHDKPGGCVTSFYRKGVSFDCGLEGLYELKPGEAIPQFFEFWGKKIETQKCRDIITCYVDANKFTFDSENIEADFYRQFPNNSKAVNKILAIHRRMLQEMYSGSEAPKPPYDMSLGEIIRFGISNIIKKPTFMRYGMKNASTIFQKTIKDDELSSVIFSKAGYEMVYMGYAYRWAVLGENYYPVGGMQCIPDLATEIIKQNGAELLLNTEVSEVLTDGNKAIGVKTNSGREFYADCIISNISPEYTLKLLPKALTGTNKLINKTKDRKVFPSAAIIFVVMKPDYDFNGSNYISIMNKQSYKHMDDYTKDDCPILIQVSPNEKNIKGKAVTILLPLSYHYEQQWHSEKHGVRGNEYRNFKEEVKETILKRVSEKLGKEFTDNILYSEISTPLTYERYLHSTEGSFMGFAIDKDNYGKFLKQKTDIEGLHMVGQYVFPGFGVVGVMASGYYLAKDLLAIEGIDLKKEFEGYFSKKK